MAIPQLVKLDLDKIFEEISNEPVNPKPMSFVDQAFSNLAENDTIKITKAATAWLEQSKKAPADLANTAENREKLEEGFKQSIKNNLTLQARSIGVNFGSIANEILSKFEGNTGKILNTPKPPEFNR